MTFFVAKEALVVWPRTVRVILRALWIALAMSLLTTGIASNVAQVLRILLILLGGLILLLRLSVTGNLTCTIFFTRSS